MSSPHNDSSLDTPRWKLIGPGLIVAATGIGAADIVATLIAGQKYGYALLWAVVMGVIIKIVLVEGVGRWTLATGESIYEGWRKVGRWTAFYFGPYIVIWGFVYGATAMASSAIPLATLFPGVPVPLLGTICGLVGAALVWAGRYTLFERITAFFVGVMFVVIVGLAIIVGPNIGDILAGLIPSIPEGSIFNLLAVAGGVGGTITLAAYGYWLKEKGWVAPKFMRVMRIDNAVAYIVSGIFVISMLIVGAELLYSANIAVASGDKGLLDLNTVLTERYGPIISPIFLIGFFAASFSSLLGVWNGVSLMFADFWGRMRKLPEGDPRAEIGGSYYKFYIFWLTIPPLIIVWLIKSPIQLILVYGVLGALFMPFLAITLLVLLNSKNTPKEWRNKWYTNLVLGLCAVFYLTTGFIELWNAIARSKLIPGMEPIG